MPYLIHIIILIATIFPQTAYSADIIHKITATAEQGGKISPKGEVSVIHSVNKRFTITADPGHEIAYLIVDGNMVKPEALYTFKNVTENHSIQAVFKQKQVYTISAIAGENGTITPSGSMEIFEYSNQKFKIIPDAGYTINKVIVDDTELLNISDEYTFWDILDNHTIKVNFVPARKFAIMAKAEEGGSITPSGQIIVEEHRSQMFKISANKGYMIDSIYVDQKKTGPRDKFIFENIDKNHSILVTFYETRYIRGQVTDSDTQEGLSDSTIEAWSVSTQGLVGIAISDANGNYTLNNIPPIAYLILRCQPPSDMPLELIVDKKDPVDDNTNDPPKNDDPDNSMPDNNQSDDILPDDKTNLLGNLDTGNKLLKSMGGDLSGDDYSGGDYSDGDYSGGDYSGGDYSGGDYSDGDYSGGDYSGGDYSGGDYSGEDPSSGGTGSQEKEKMDIRQSKYAAQYYNNKEYLTEADMLSTIDGNLEGIDFALKAYDDIGFRGRVHDGENGVSNVMINAFSGKKGFNKFAITDANGDYTINYLIPSDDYIVTADFPMLKMHVYYSVEKNQTIGIDSPTSSALLPNFASMITPSKPYLENIDLIFDTGAQISGHIYDANNRPMKNIHVNAWSDANRRGNSATTDQSGAYTIIGLTEVPESASATDGYRVDIISGKYPYQAYDHVTDPRMATLVATGRTDIDFHLLDGFSVSGQVLTTEGFAMENAFMILYSQSSRTEKKALTNENGFFVFESLTPANDYILACHAMNYPVQFYNQQSSLETSDYIDILMGSKEDIRFVLDQGAIIYGEVRLPEERKRQGQQSGQEPKPKEEQFHAMVHIWSISQQTGGGCQVEADGSFLMAGLDENISDYMIMVKVKDFPDAFYADNGDDNNENDTVYDRSKAIGIAPSDNPIIITLDPGLSISGSITIVNNRVPGLKVIAWSEETGMHRHTIAYPSANGFVYEIIGLSSGIYYVYVDSKDFFSEPLLVAVEDSHVENANFVLEEIQGYEISGHVYNLPADEMVMIYAWSLSLDYGKKIRIKGFGKGLKYRIKGLYPASDYVVSLISDNFPTIVYDSKSTFQEANLVDLSQGDIRNIDFEIDDSSSDIMISGTITFPENAQTGEPVYIYAHSKKKRASKSVSLTLGAVNPMPYSLMGVPMSTDIVVSIWPENYPHQFYENQETGELATKIDTTDDIADIVNFSLDAGRSISGRTIDADGLTVVNARVSIFSESTGSRAFSLSDENGDYLISGLKPVDDFILMAYEKSMGTFYYESNSSSARNRVDATSLDLSADSQTDVIITMSEGYTISGSVQSIAGLYLENVRVDAWSETLESGSSAFTDENGEFTIQGLPSGMDYQMTATPDKSMSYQSQTKNYIESGSTDIQFMLSPLETFTLYGTVMDADLTPVYSATVKICNRNDLADCAWDRTNENGFYEINGITESSNYQIDIVPASDSSLSFSRIYPFGITSDESLNITLSEGVTISGSITAESSGAAISNANIQVISESTGFYEEVNTGIDGTYEITKVPDVADFEITASATNFIDSTLTDQSATDSIDFSLESGGTISGYVSDAASGSYIENATVEIYSYANQNTQNYGSIVKTNSDGYYEVNQLKIQDGAGDTIADYIVKAYGQGYPEQTQSGNMTGDTVDMYLYAGSGESIVLTVNDASGLLTDTTTVIVSYYKENRYAGRKEVKSLNSFSISCLTSDTEYKFLFSAYESGQEILSQWASANGMGETSMDMAGTFTVGQTINFTFQPLRKRLFHRESQGPGPVRKLRSTTHDYYTVNKRLRTSNLDTSTVSNDPNITVTWDAPEDGEDDLSGYYAGFNNNDAYAHSAVNTSDQPVVQTRKITSADLEGDDVYFYFHVAAVDVEGRIGQTTSIAFRIDTIAPTNVSVVAPDYVNDRNIALTLGATGASIVYISNVNYGESGDSYNISTETQWRLSRGNGLKTIFVRFNDAAGNASDTLAVTTYEEVLENSGPMISDRTFTITENLSDDLFIGFIEATDADNDPLTFTFESSQNQGFGLAQDSGLLFVESSDIFPSTPETYDLTVTVQDAAEESTAIVRVNVSVSNYPPEMENQSFSIDEHSDENTIIGMINAVDQDGDSIVYSIIDGNTSEIFNLNPDSGILSVAQTLLLDYEIHPTYELTVGASDSQITTTAQITINLNNINDHAPSIQSMAYTINENAPQHSIVANLTVSDADGQTPVCSIESGNDAQAFYIDICSLKVNEAALLDYETDPNIFTLNIVASDGSLSNAANISIHVSNINDNAPEILPQVFILPENTSIHEAVYTLTASDADQLSNLVFSIQSESSDFPFEIAADSGIISLASSLDYELKNTYTATAIVFDNAYTSTESLIIHISNINDNPPAMEDQYFNFFETTPNETIIGSLTAFDADGDTLTMTLNNNENTFSILPDKQLKITDNQLIDNCEQCNAIVLTVTVSDGLFSDQAIITLSITPVNDHAPVLENTDIYLSENTSIGELVKQLEATDADFDPITYTLIDGNSRNDFLISPNGRISLNNALDFETQSSYTLTVRVSDGHFDDTGSISIHIINDNDNPPIAENLNCFVSENSLSQEVVCEILALDADNNALQYSSSSHLDVFLVDAETGKIRIHNTNLLDYEAQQAYTIVTAISDSVYTIIHHTWIQVINENDLPPEIIVLPIQTNEDYPISTCVEMTDPDNDSLTLMIESQGDKGIAALTTQACLMYTPNENANGEDIIYLFAYDGLHQSEVKPLTITIYPIDDPPVISPLSNISISEDSISEVIDIPITDIDTPFSLIHAQVISENTALIPNSETHILLNQLDNQFNLQLMPSSNQSGTAQISVSVWDEHTTVYQSFTCNVSDENDPPEISTILNLTMNEDTISQAIPITISDNETPSEALSLTVFSTNSDIIPNHPESLSLVRMDSYNELFIQPLPDMNGEGTIIVEVSDGSQSSSQAISIVVIPVNDPPEFENIQDIIMDEDTSETIMLNISDLETAVQNLNLSIACNQPELLPQSGLWVYYIQAEGQHALNIQPEENMFGHAQLTVLVSDESFTISQSFQLTVNEINDPPVIHEIPDQTVAENTAIGPIPLQISDVETAAVFLSITITSSHPDLIPIDDKHVTIDSQSLILTPMMYVSGNAVITITISDAQLTAQTSFEINVSAVDQAPEISAIDNQTIDEDHEMPPQSFTVWDAETLPQELDIRIESDNKTLIPDNPKNIQLTYQDNEFLLRIIPEANQNGSANITITAHDGTNTTQSSFTLLVQAVEDLPELVPPIDIQLQEDAPSRTIAFQVSDAETPYTELQITTLSDNTDLISNESIQISGNTEQRWLSISINPGTFGMGHILLTLSDSAGNEVTHTQTIKVDRGNTLEFNGENDYVEIPDDESLHVQNPPLSVEVWINPCENVSGRMEIVSKLDDNYQGFSLGLKGDRHIEVITGNAAQSVTLVSNTTITPNLWTHIAVAIDLQHIHLFINGLFDKSIANENTVDLNHPYPLIFGGKSHMPTANSYCGTMDDVRLWQTARTETQIQENMLKRLPGNTEGLLGYWHFKDNNANDHSKNDYLNHGIIHKDAPMISKVSDQYTHEDISPEIISFNVSDLQSEASDLTVSVSSSDHQLLPPQNMILSGTDSQRYLQLVPASNQFGQCTITLSVDDGETVTHRSFELVVMSVNDAPVIEMDSQWTIIEDSLAQSITFAASDIDSQDIAKDLNLEITSDNPDAIQSMFANMETGLFTLTPTVNFFGELHLTVHLTDGELSDNAALTITVLSVNDFPQMSLIGNQELHEDSQETIYAFTVDDIETEASQLTVSVVYSQSEPQPFSSIYLSGQGSDRQLHVEPKPNLSGTAMITITVTDNDLAAVNQPLTITVLPVNDPPQLSEIRDQTIIEDTQLFQIAFSIMDIETNASELMLSFSSSNADLLSNSNINIIGTNEPRSLILTPNPNEYGTTDIQIILSDPEGLQVSQIFTLTVMPENDAPAITCKSKIIMMEDSQSEAIKITLSDLETQSADLEIIAQSNKPDLIDTNGCIFSDQYTFIELILLPKENRYGNAVITLTVSDPQGLSAQTALSVTVLEVNDPPSISAIDNITFPEDTIPEAIAISVTDIETPLDQLQVSFDLESTGIISLTNTAIHFQDMQYLFTIAPMPNSNGQTSICLTVTDEENLTASSCFAITVTEVNDLPQLSDFSNISTLEDMPISPISFTISDIETPAHALTIDFSSSNPSLINTDNFWVQGEKHAREIHITPFADTAGSSWITLTVADQHNGTISKSFYVQINAVNDPPTIEPIADMTVSEDMPISPVYVFAHDLETPEKDLHIYIFLTSAYLSYDDITTGYNDKVNAHELNINTIPNASGNSTIMVEIADSGGLTAITSFEITQTQVNDPPEISEISDQTVQEDCSSIEIPIKPFDLETPIEMLSIQQYLENSSLLTFENISLVDETYMLQLSCVPNAFGSSQIQVLATDAGGLTAIEAFHLTVIQVNDPPTIESVENIESKEDMPIEPVELQINDIDNPNNTLSIDVIIENNQLVSSTEVSYTQLTLIPAANANGLCNIQIVVSDSQGLSASTIFTWTITPQNDPPQISEIADITIKEDHPGYTLTYACTHVDFPNQNLSISMTSSQKEVIDPDKQNFNLSTAVIFPEPNQWGIVNACFTVTDPNSLTAISCFDISITSVNDSPTIIIENAYTLNEDGSQQITLTVKDIDTNILPEMIQVQNNGLFTISQAIMIDSYFAFSITPSQHINGQWTFSIQVDDTNGGTDTQDIQINVLPINDIPIANSNTWQTYEDIPYEQTLTGSDIDQDPLSYTIVQQPQYGNITFIDEDRISYEPLSHYHGIDGFLFTVTDGHATSEPAWITVNIQPVPDSPTAIAGNDITVNEMTRVILDASASYDPDHDIAFYEWNQIDGVSVALSDTNGVTVSFTAEDVINDQRLTFELSVTDITGRPHKDTINVLIWDISPPTPEFSSDPIVGNVPLAVQFSDHTLGKVSSWEWEFGDGYISREQNPSHVYDKPGEYSVMLTVEGPYGIKTKEKTDYLWIKAADLKADFDTSLTTGLAPLSITFTNLSEGEFEQMTWDFGDNVRSTLFSPVHTFDMPGNYTVSLIISDQYLSDVHQKSMQIHVTGRSISGVIRSKENPEETISGCSITASIGYDSFQGISDDSGYYTITGLPASDNIKLSAYPPSENTQFLGQFFNDKDSLAKADLLTTESNDLIQINFYLDPMSSLTIHGKIHDSNKVGIANVPVFANASDIQWTSQSISDENGLYTLTGLKASLEYSVSAWWEEQQTQVFYALPDNQVVGQDIPENSQFDSSFARKIPLTNQNLNQINIILTIHDTTITGKITDKNGHERQGIRVNAWSEGFQTGSSALSDRSGNYTILGLQNVSDIDSQGYKVFVQMNGYHEYSEKLGVPSTNINFVLPVATSISGRVTDSSGQAVTTACIEAWSSSDINQKIYTTCTINNGYYTLSGLPFRSDYIVKCVSSEYFDQYYANEREKQAAQKVDLSDGMTHPINFTLLPVGSIQGKIYITSTDSPAPQCIWVNVLSTDHGISHQAQTDSNGNFEIIGLDTNINDYILSINHPDYLPAFYCESDSFYSCTKKFNATTVYANSGSYSLVLQTGESVCGVIIGAIDDVSSLRMTASGQSHGISQSASISEGITPGFCFQALKIDYYSFKLFQNNNQIGNQDILVSSSVDNIVFNISTTPKREISGQVSGLPEGIWGQIRVWSESLQKEKTMKVLGTGDSFTYSISNLPPADDYSAMLSSPVSVDLYYSDKLLLSERQKIDLSTNNQQQINFTLDQPASISGRISLEPNNLFNGTLKLSVGSESLGVNPVKTIQIQSETEIFYTITGLPKAKDYIACVQSDETGYHYYPDSSQASQAVKIDLVSEVNRNDIDFDLSTGIQVIGTISSSYSLAKLSVEMENIENGQIFIGTIEPDHSFKIKGLTPESTYVLCVNHNNGRKFYYTDHSVVFTKQAAKAIYLSQSASYDFTIPQELSIGGIVRSSNGSMMAGVWIQVSDPMSHFVTGGYSDDNGQFIISSLPNQKFVVTAIPDQSSGYSKSIKTDIDPGNMSLLFILDQRSGEVLSGQVTDLKQSPEENARIEVINTEKEMIQTHTDRNGEFTISGLTKGQNYCLNVYPASNSQSAFWHGCINALESEHQMNIELSEGVYMQGSILAKDSKQPVFDATVIWESESTGYYAIVQTNANGLFTCNNMPESTDYVVRVIADHYQSVMLINEQPELSRTIFMIPSGTVKGFVVDQQTGLPIAMAFIRIQSGSQGIDLATQTDANGYFEQTGIPEKNAQGSQISDYTFQVMATDYPSKTVHNIQMGQEISIALSKLESLQLQGIINNPSDDNWLIDIFESQGNFIKNQMVQSNQLFNCNGLNKNIYYQLRISPAPFESIYWINVLFQLVDNRDLAGNFSVSSFIEVDTSSPNIKQKRNQKQSLPILKINSLSHTIYSLERPHISSIPVIQMQTDFSDQFLGYYIIFNRQADYVVDKSNTSGQHYIQSKIISSPPFTGDQEDIYCHAALVDNLGNIGPTTHAGPYRIDTLPPESPYIKAPGTTQTRRINIQAFAEGASDVYISTTGYETFGYWQPYANEYTFLLPSEPGQYILYMSFRDKANNISRTHSSISLEDPENTAPIPIAQSFSIEEDKILSENLKGNDSDGDHFYFQIQNEPEHGSLTLMDRKTGEFQYQPSQNFAGVDHFSFVVSDGLSTSQAATCSITIQNQNDSPQIVASEIKVIENSSYSGKLDAIDIDNDSLFFEIFSQPLKGDMYLTNPTTGDFQYVPYPDTSGKDSFMITVTDGTVTSAPQIIEIEIIPENPSDHWYTDGYPDGYLIDNKGNPLENIAVIYWSESQKSYTCLTDSYGYFLFETKASPESLYPLNVSGTNIWLHWTHEVPTQTFTFVRPEDSDATLITGSCLGIAEDTEVLIQAGNVATRSVSGVYTLAVQEIPVDLKASAPGYEPIEINDVYQGQDIIFETKAESRKTDDGNEGCFIEALF